MKKLLLTLSSLGLISSGVSAIIAAAPLTKSNTRNNADDTKIEPQEDLINSLEIIRKNTEYIIEAKNESQKGNYFVQEMIQPNDISVINLESSVSNKLKRMYVDSSKDNQIPGYDKNYDKTQSKAKNNQWYSNEIHMVDINVLDYATSKQSFLKNINYIEINSNIFYNFWASGFGWESSGGKSPSSVNMTHRFSLTGDDKYNTIVSATDTLHKGRESIQIQIKEEWNDNILSFKIKLLGKVWWKWGSVYNHAAIVGMQNETLKLYKSDEFENEELKHYSTIMPGTFTQRSSINGAITDVATPALKLIEADLYEKYDKWKADDIMILNLAGVFMGDLIAPPGWKGYAMLSMPNLYDIAKLITDNIKKGYPVNSFSVDLVSKNNGIKMWGELYFVINGKQIFITKSNEIRYIPGAMYLYTGAYEASVLISTTSN
ncbi:hypothetical protein CXP39_01830 [Mesoplasma syrphidae]|uniref:Uncharacterized protein n=1 Tax=Mesoplasma syrphidae TaxID=225999 RepID=A0A2K9BUY6_9MOLU|nr:hypothetical protein [Mesoplasma syrphidae]AUF83530.1 hypothetical protein CXP39_01830 [Mesoplasma syrphidae]